MQGSTEIRMYSHGAKSEGIDHLQKSKTLCNIQHSIGCSPRECLYMYDVEKNRRT